MIRGWANADANQASWQPQSLLNCEGSGAEPENSSCQLCVPCGGGFVRRGRLAGLVWLAGDLVLPGVVEGARGRFHAPFGGRSFRSRLAAAGCASEKIPSVPKSGGYRYTRSARVPLTDSGRAEGKLAALYVDMRPRVLRAWGCRPQSGFASPQRAVREQACASWSCRSAVRRRGRRTLSSLSCSRSGCSGRGKGHCRATREPRTVTCRRQVGWKVANVGPLALASGKIAGDATSHRRPP